MIVSSLAWKSLLQKYSHDRIADSRTRLRPGYFCAFVANLPHRRLLFAAMIRLRHHAFPRLANIAWRTYLRPESRTRSAVSFFSSASVQSPSSPESTGACGIFRLLNDEERRLLEEQRSLTAAARQLTQQIVGLSKLAANEDNPLRDAAAFCVVVAGEFNAGKSTLINALIGVKRLEMGSLPTTDCVTILSHATVEGGNDDGTRSRPRLPRFPGVIYHTVDNLPLLEDMTLVDTPGTNAVIVDHTSRTLRLLPSADLILFCTSADRPFPESERTLLASIAEYRKSIVIVINKMDILESAGGAHGAEEKQLVIDFVTEHASDLLGARPMVLAVSSRDALAAKLTSGTEAAVWKRSNFSTLETFLRDTLTTETKIKAKLSSPIGVAEGQMAECLRSLQLQRDDLQSDIATLNLLASQLAAWRSELENEMGRARSELSEVLEQEGGRGKLLLRRMDSRAQFYQLCLFDSSRLAQEWDKTQPINASTIGDTRSIQASLLELVRQTADSIAIHGRAQGQAVIEFLGKRPSSKSNSLVGSVTAASRFEETRQSLSESLTLAVQRHVDVDQHEEETKVLQKLQSAARLSAALNATAVLSVAASAAQLVDWMVGFGVGSACGIAGLALLSYMPKQVAAEFEELWRMHARYLDDAVSAVCSKELERVERRVRDGVAPYSRFVEAEGQRIDMLSKKCEDVVFEAQRLRKQIVNLR